MHTKITNASEFSRFDSVRLDQRIFYLTPQRADTLSLNTCVKTVKNENTYHETPKTTHLPEPLV